MIYHLHPYTLNHLHDAECIKYLGRGTFGDVKLYKCKDKDQDGQCRCNKVFVVKQIKPVGLKKDSYFLKKLRKTLLNEYTIGTLLHHPCIRETLDVDLHDNAIIFEYCPGVDFLNYIKHDKPKFEDEIFYFKQLLDGIDYMHNIGIAHMDIKLENIMIDTNNKQIKIIDFGESRVFHDSLHISSIIPEKGLHGSLPYIAPEEFENKEYNPEKVDVWSCGIILYAIIYNSIPWYKADISDLLFKKFLLCCNVNKFDICLPETTFRNMLIKMLNPNPDNRSNIHEIKLYFDKNKLLKCNLDL